MRVKGWKTALSSSFLLDGGVEGNGDRFLWGELTIAFSSFEPLQSNENFW